MAAVLVGFAKTALGGVGAISVAIFAAVLPARESTGALLPLLIVGDLLAVRAYRRHADWGIVLRLLPAVGVGIVVGTVFLGRVNDTVMRRTIGAVLLLLVVLHLLVERRRTRRVGAGDPDVDATASPWRRRAVVALAGLMAGFTTMVANSGGPVMSLYLLSAGLPVLGFLGTTAWFFFVLNVVKVPFSVALGLITVESLALCAALAPAVVVGALVGRRVIDRISKERFESSVLVLSALAGLNLLR